MSASLSKEYTYGQLMKMMMNDDDRLTVSSLKLSP